jgi:hypothetical protein
MIGTCTINESGNNLIVQSNAAGICGSTSTVSFTIPKPTGNTYNGYILGNNHALTLIGDTFSDTNLNNNQCSGQATRVSSIVNHAGNDISNYNNNSSTSSKTPIIAGVTGGVGAIAIIVGIIVYVKHKQGKKNKTSITYSATNRSTDVNLTAIPTTETATV